MRLFLGLLTFITLVKPIIWVPSFIPAYGLRAAGDVKYTMVVSCLTMWLCRVSLCIFSFRALAWALSPCRIGMFSDLDREGNLLYKTVYEQKMAGVSCALT